jgi:hypothetical protein
MHLANNDPCINPIRHFAYPEPRSSVASLTSRRRGNIKLRLSHLEKDGALALRLGGSIAIMLGSVLVQPT